MCYLNAIRLGRYPLDRMVKVGDTVVDVLEGGAAGMWTVATLLGGNEVGLSQAAEAALGEAEAGGASVCCSRQTGRRLVHTTCLRPSSELPAVLDVHPKPGSCPESMPSVRRRVRSRLYSSRLGRKEGQ